MVMSETSQAHAACPAPDLLLACVQLHSKTLGKVVDIVVSHQGLPRKMSLVAHLLNVLVLPAPEHYRPLLRRMAVLGKHAK